MGQLERIEELVGDNGGAQDVALGERHGKGRLQPCDDVAAEAETRLALEKLVNKLAGTAWVAAVRCCVCAVVQAGGGSPGTARWRRGEAGRCLRGCAGDGRPCL